MNNGWRIKEINSANIVKEFLMPEYFQPIRRYDIKKLSTRGRVIKRRRSVDIVKEILMLENIKLIKTCVIKRMIFSEDKYSDKI